MKSPVCEFGARTEICRALDVFLAGGAVAGLSARAVIMFDRSTLNALVRDLIQGQKNTDGSKY
jgi:peroxiredoxin